MSGIAHFSLKVFFFRFWEGGNTYKTSLKDTEKKCTDCFDLLLRSSIQFFLYVGFMKPFKTAGQKSVTGIKCNFLHLPHVHTFRNITRNMNKDVPINKI